MEMPTYSRLQYYCYACEDVFVAEANSNTCTNCGAGFVEQRTTRSRYGILDLPREIAFEFNEYFFGGPNRTHHTSAENRERFSIIMANNLRGIQYSEPRIRPLSQQSIADIPTVQLSAEQFAEKLSCVICITEFNESEVTKTLACAHSFHPPCIEEWLKYCGTCPICRKPIEGTPESPIELDSDDDVEDLTIDRVLPNFQQLQQGHRPFVRESASQTATRSFRPFLRATSPFRTVSLPFAASSTNQWLNFPPSNARAFAVIPSTAQSTAGQSSTIRMTTLRIPTIRSPTTRAPTTRSSSRSSTARSTVRSLLRARSTAVRSSTTRSTNARSSNARSSNARPSTGQQLSAPGLQRMDLYTSLARAASSRLSRSTHNMTTRSRTHRRR